MEELLYTATPEKSATTILFLILLLAFLIVFTYSVETKKIKMLHVYRQISFLLGGLLSLIVLATTLFSTWNYYTIQPIKLYETYLESFQGKTNYKDIIRAGIFNDREQSLVNSQVTIREDNILIIEKRVERNKKLTYLFAEENYDIRALVKRIQEQMKKVE